MSPEEINAVFTERQQMAIPQATVTRGLMTEGISTVEDLGEFEDKDFKTILDNLHKPGGTIPDLVDANNRIPTPSYVIGAKSLKCLKIAAAAAIRYYEAVGRECTVANMYFQNVLKNFGEEWEVIMQKKSEDEAEVPKITRSLPIVQWMESFEDFWHQVIGSRCIALSYLIRDNVDPVPPCW